MCRQCLWLCLTHIFHKTDGGKGLRPRAGNPHFRYWEATGEVEQEALNSVVFFFCTAVFADLFALSLLFLYLESAMPLTIYATFFNKVFSDPT